MMLDELDHFLVDGKDCHGECLKRRQYLDAVPEISARELTYDERMTDNLPLVQQKIEPDSAFS
jgi:hypothetical protein